MSERLPFAASELRARTIRGVAINAAFLVVVEMAALAQGLIVARILGPSEIGLYGIVSITVMTLIALKRVGIDEAYVQQDEGGEEEFARAFTLELVLSAAFTAALCALAPVVSAAAASGSPTCRNASARQGTTKGRSAGLMRLKA